MDPARLVYLGSGQTAPTFTGRHTHTSGLALTVLEAAQLRYYADKGRVLDESDKERTQAVR